MPVQHDRTSQVLPGVAGRAASAARLVVLARAREKRWWEKRGEGGEAALIEMEGTRLEPRGEHKREASAGHLYFLGKLKGEPVRPEHAPRFGYAWSESEGRCVISAIGCN